MEFSMRNAISNAARNLKQLIRTDTTSNTLQPDRE
jgi:hypothetical protein